ncbi:hypothetical protein Dda_4196 [Drechslerella dactyloides]|uniref:Phospholipase A2 n=1 Tax=Drechslerella dactyloides TaxID=74499 RepID=A0AAD6J3M2_DREDA|nr:hypothetical protein Dda_4196 [Drechslerella dactyloides]
MFSKNLLFCTFTALAVLSQAAPAPSSALQPASNLAIRAPSELSVRAIVPIPCNDEIQCAITGLIFQSPMEDFIQKRKEKYLKPDLIWKSDGCSVPEEFIPLLGGNKNEPFGFPFKESCLRHDFGYRNLKKQGMFTPNFVKDPNRETLDEVFHRDMGNACRSKYPGLLNLKGIQSVSYSLPTADDSFEPLPDLGSLSKRQKTPMPPTCSAKDPEYRECLTDQLLFSTPMAEFIADQKKKLYSPPLKWGTDGCSLRQSWATAAGWGDKDKPKGYKFMNACRRHDFGYRNYKLQQRFTASNKAKIDNNFKADLQTQCRAQFPVDSKSSLAKKAQLADCLEVANLYFLGVQNCQLLVKACAVQPGRKM